MSRKWSDIPQYQKDDPTWGIEPCCNCQKYEGDNLGLNGNYVCENCLCEEKDEMTFEREMAGAFPKFQ